jgi:hypothetical protein
VERLDNDYLIDRQEQKTVSFTGIKGIRAQDAMVTETAGPIADRTREHLGSSDIAVVAMRRALMQAATLCAESGLPHPVAANAWLYAARAVQAVLPENQDIEAAEDFLSGARAPLPVPPLDQ